MHEECHYLCADSTTSCVRRASEGVMSFHLVALRIICLSFKFTW